MNANSTITKNILYFTILFAFLSCITLMFAPPFFTYDSYHYLYLSLKPHYGDSHSIFFGFFLRALANISELISTKSFTTTFLLWNTFCLTLLFFIPTKHYICAFRAKGEIQKIKNKKAFYFLFFTLLVTIFSNFLLVNAFWSEMTSLFFLFLFAIASKKYLETGKLNFLFFLSTIFPIAYHTRYLMILLPACLAALLFLQFIKYKNFRFLAINRKRLAVAIVSSMIVLATTNRILSITLPNLNIKRDTTALVLNSSMQCALRCHTKMFETDCSTPEGKKIIEGSLCRDIIFGLVKTGNPIADPTSILNIFKQNGFFNSVMWLFIAPITYLTDRHDLEVGLFSFGKDEAPSKAYPEVIEYYGQFFDGDTPEVANSSFQPYVKVLHNLFYSGFFHLLTVFTIFSSIYALFKTKHFLVAILATYAIGNYLVFAYLNPHVPFRFLMQIISPGIIATCLFLFEKQQAEKCNSAKSIGVSEV